MLHQAAAHHGSSFVEVYQNCVIFNPNEWQGIDDRRTRDENILYLEDGKPMIFGKDHDKGIRLNGFQPEVVDLGNGFNDTDLVVHDPESVELGYILSNMEWPVPMGVFRQVEGRPSYSDSLMAQIQQSQAQRGVGDLNNLYRAADMWTVTAREHAEADMAGEMADNLDEAYVDAIDQPAGKSR